MSEVVNVEVASAIVVAGRIVLPGQVVQVSVGDARMLVAQGKVVRMEDAEPDTAPAGNGQAPAEPEEHVADPVARAPKARTAKTR